MSGRRLQPTRVWYLRMDDPAALRPPRRRSPEADVRRSEMPSGPLNRFFYDEIGWEFEWVDRREWTREDWQAYVEQPELETWLLTFRGTPSGYAELERQAGGEWEVRYFGLLAFARGWGLGSLLLHDVVRRAWDAGATAVTVSTCELDDPAALASYQARGFTLVEETIELRGRRS